MTRPADDGGSEIINDFFDAWLDGQSAQRTDDAANHAQPSRPGSDSLSLSTLINRATRCADLIVGAWPAPETADEKRPGPVAGDDGVKAPLFSVGPPQPWSAPTHVGRYAIVEELGRGRFGIVYRAHDSRLGRDVAIKIARPEVSSREDLTRRFLHEATAAARLDHPGIVPVHDAGESGQTLYYVMTYCPGEDLSRWLARQHSPVDPRLAAELIRQLSEATSYGHTQGIVHRDLKPANVLLTQSSAATGESATNLRAQILDFGLSRSLEDDLRETRSSMIVGTPLYMSPEQARAGRSDVGPATDVFALGAILYELLTGAPPFAAGSLPEVIEQLSQGEAIPPRRHRPGLDSRLELICLKCLRLHPEDRYRTAQELADDLSRFLDDSTVSARRATFRDHLRWWSMGKQRIVEAGATLFAGNTALAGSMLLLASAPQLDPSGSMALVPAPDLALSMIPGAAGGLTLGWMGLKVMRGSRRALQLCTLATALQWTICLAVLFFGVPPLIMYDGNPRAKWIMYLYLQVLFSFNLAMCLVALRAQRRLGST